MRFPKPFLALLLSSWLCHIQGNDNYFHSHEKPTNSNIGKLSHNPFEIYNTNYSEHQHSQLSRAGTNEKHYVRLENGTYSEDGIGNTKFSFIFSLLCQWPMYNGCLNHQVSYETLLPPWGCIFRVSLTTS